MINVDEQFQKTYKGYKSYKTHRNTSGWDSNAKKSENFYFGDQWDSGTKRMLSSQRRPFSVFNMILPAVDSLIGHHIETRVDMVAKAIDRFADPYIAKFLTQTFKYIENLNDVPFERKAQFIDGLITGIGVKENWHEEDVIGEGKIKVEQKSPWNFYLDPNFKRYDYSDAQRLYRDSWLTKKQIEVTYGKEIAKDIQIPDRETLKEYPLHLIEKGYNENTDYGNISGTMSEAPIDDQMYEMGYDIQGNLIRVIEEYEKRWEEVEYYFNPETSKWDKVDMLTDEEKELVKNLTIKKYEPHIHITTIIGIKVVQDEALEATEFYHIFNFFFPYFVNGKYMGVIENLWYPQEEINKRHSTIVHILTSIGNSGIFFTDEAFSKATEEDIATKLAKTGWAIKVDSLYDNQNRKTIEQREPPQVPDIYTRLIEMEKENIKYIPGALDQLQGIGRRKESGVAKRTEIERGITRLSGMIENFFKTQRLEGKAYIWWIQNKFTEEKMIRIYGDKIGDTEEEIVLNRRAMGQIANDVTIGEYDVVIAFEGRTRTEREHTYWKLIELANTTPQYADIIGEIVLDYFDLPEKDKIKQKWVERQQILAQERMMGMMPQQSPNRGPITTATRPSRGPRREPQKLAT